MDEVSALGYALLCALHKEPLTGYDLVRRMHRPIGYYWSARQSQIYPELSRLTAAGHGARVPQAVCVLFAPAS